MIEKIIRPLVFSHKGMRKENQDAYSVCTRETDFAARNMNRGEVFIVADGMGGHNSGRQAAKETCRRIVDLYFSPRSQIGDRDDEIEVFLRAVLKEVNQDLYEKARQNPDCAGWGSTASMLLLRDDRYYFAHAGDSRIYLIQKGKAELLTEDHNVAFQMHRFGKTTYEEYLTAPGHNKLLSFMAQGDEIDVQTGQGRFLDQDIFLLCTDGLNQFCEFRDVDQLAEKFTGDLKEDPMTAIFEYLKTEHTDPKISKDNLTFMLVDRQGIKSLMHDDRVDFDQVRQVFFLDENDCPEKYTQNMLHDNGDGTITDHGTGLMWEQAGSDKEVHCKVVSSHIHCLNENRFAGWNDWRLPTIAELLTLVEPEPGTGGLYLDPMFDPVRRWCWSANTQGPDAGWIVRFEKGRLSFGCLGSYYVKGVRQLSS
jgi:PPM family protein phosphatase